MKQEEEWLDKNMTLLLRAAANRNARPGIQVRERVFHRLLTHLRTQSAEVSFPDAIVGILGVLLALAMVWLVNVVVGTDVSWSTLPTSPFVTVALVLNLALLPVACFMILWRRRNG
jgi:hypothetical protein